MELLAESFAFFGVFRGGLFLSGVKSEALAHPQLRYIVTSRGNLTRTSSTFLD